jgi:uncharacterized YccA/Bax inhibitor family protein
MAFKTGNPALNAKTFDEFSNSVSGFGSKTELMTLDGTVGKSFILLALLIAGASWTWHLWYQAHEVAAVIPWLIGSGLSAFIVALVTCFKRDWAPVTAPVYAILEGLALGAISAFYEAKYSGIVINAVGLTMGTFLALLMAYASRLIRPSENFKLGVVAATGGICIVYLVTIVLGLFHVTVPFIHDSGPIGIGFSVFVTIIAALNLVLDFDFIENGSKAGAPKYMEWYASFGLLVTLVWLYLEILRLLSKVASRR